jgi:hypothetical protein
LVLPYHKLSGVLPALPQGLVWLDLRANSISTMPCAFFWEGVCVMFF